MDAPSAAGAVQRLGRGRVFDSIVDAIGDTPLERLRPLPQAHGVTASSLAKLEYSPAASVTDPIGATGERRQSHRRDCAVIRRALSLNGIV